MVDYYLVSDSERFNAVFPRSSKLSDMAGSDRYRVRMIAHYGYTKEYRQDITGFKFSVTTVFN